MDPLWKMHFRVTRACSTELIGYKEMIWLKLETVACLQFAGPYLVLDDTKSDGFGWLWKWISNQRMFHWALQTLVITWFWMFRTISARAGKLFIGPFIRIAEHRFRLALKCGVYHTWRCTRLWVRLRLLWTTFYPFTLKVGFQVHSDYTEKRYIQSRDPFWPVACEPARSRASKYVRPICWVSNIVSGLSHENKMAVKAANSDMRMFVKSSRCKLNNFCHRL